MLFGPGLGLTLQRCRSPVWAVQLLAALRKRATRYGHMLMSAIN
jgi:hypothetical protein